MKNVVVYSSTYGYAEKCAADLSKKLKGPTDLVNVKNTGPINVQQYDNVIIGSSIYMGQMNKSLKEFMQNNLELLTGKRVGIFVCCGFPEQLQKTLEFNVPKKLLGKALAVECFGGQMDPTKMSFMHKFITKMVTKATEKDGVKKTVEPLPENIDKMAQAFNAG